MSRGRALGLTDAQLRLVHEAARNVAPSHRERFLSAIADHLMGKDVVDDRDVQDAVVSALLAFQVGGGHAA